MLSINAIARHTGLVSVLLLSLAAPALRAQSVDAGVQRFESGDWAGARAEFSAAVQRTDRDGRAHYYLGRLAMLDDDIDAAATQFERAVALDQSVSNYHLWYGNALSQQAVRASKLKLPFIAKHVKAEFDRAVELDPRNVDARESLADLYSMAPAFMGGSVEKAREQAQAVAHIDAARGHLAAARIAVNTNDASTAEREMNAAIASAPDALRGYAALANWRMKQKQWPQAFAAIEPYLTKHPEDPYGPYWIGRVAAASGQQLDRGEQGIRAFIANPPTDAGALVLAGAYRRLGLVLSFQGKRAEGRAAIEQALKLDPRNEEAKKALK